MDIMELVPALIEAAQGGKWSLLVSLIIMVLVWGLTKAPVLKDLIKGKAKIWVAAVAGMLAASATEIIAGHAAGAVDWMAVVTSGLMIGLGATGLWSLLARKVKGQPIDEDGDGVLDELPEDAE